MHNIKDRKAMAIYMLDQALKEKIMSAKKVAIFTHIHPDGDALGSAYSFKLAMREMGKQAEVFLSEECHTPAYSIVRGKEPSGLSVAECDLKVALDCADAARLGAVGEHFAGNTAAIDHHVTHSQFAQCCMVVPNASATGEILYDVYRELDVKITKDMAHNLYIAIVSDTGNFKYSCATARTHRIAANLIECGVDFSEITKILFDTKSYEYFKLMQVALSKLEMHCGGKVALLSLTSADFAQAGLEEAEADGIVTIPRTVAGAEVGIYIRERSQSEFKVSLRSNRYLDVAKLAEQMGGGGHIRAAGYSVFDASEQEVKDSIIAKLTKIV